ncbi:MAG TPA: CehA/McbA family metallohydrolase [Polyangia bacterium]|nr:CehA/McbA family metallohydrolase [Polyangia bacterium]
MRRPGTSVLTVVVGALAIAEAAGCHRDGCVGGDDGACLPPAACPALSYAACAAPKLRVEQIGPNDAERVYGPKALAAAGDYLLENDLVRVVLDAPDHPHFIGPSGGAILDLAPLVPSPLVPNPGDQTNAIYHAAGVLPRDAVHYETAAILDPQLDPSRPGAYAAVIFRGHLEGDARVTVVTRYEVRPCEPGVRVRTDLYNGSPDPNTLFLADGFFWGDNGLAPFVPGPGLGFVEPALDLLHVDQAWRQWPFLAARSQSSPDTAYAVVSCDRSQGAGFNSTTLTASGVPLGVTESGDGFHFERFILAEAGPSLGLAPAVAEALHIRTMVHGDPPAVTVTGRVVANGAPVDGQAGRAASLLFYEPAPGANLDDPTRVTPWNEVVPGSDGTFSVALPPNRSYRVQPYAFGLPAAAASSFVVAAGDVAIGDVTITASAKLTVDVQSSPGVAASYAELVVIPVDDPNTPGTPVPSLYSLFPGCAPMLGPPDGGSPACNRAITINGHFDVALPAGQYYVYATRGPFASLDRATVDLAPGISAQATLVVESLASQLLPAGVVSGDFHVHGGASFDSAIPDLDRVASFLATGVDVIVATDHNVVTSYASTLATLGAESAIAVIPGVEQTPNILWYYVPDDTFPKTLGHFNFWPLSPDTFQTRNGAPWSELREPGQLMDDMDALFANPATAVRQLNHPYLLAKLGRDQGYPQAIGYDPTTPIPPTPKDGFSFAANALARTPPDPTTGGPGNHSNLDWNVEEVMTGASRADWLRYRALWFSLLNQGFLRAGTANSDSHTLSVERIGYPRNLVWGNHDKTALDVDGFDADILAGHLEGTNGPVLDVTIKDSNGAVHRSDLTTSFTPGPNATMTIAVTSAPWIPFAEARVFVNGVLVHTAEFSIDFSKLDQFGTAPQSANVTLQLATLMLPSHGDAWVVVEAGLPQDTPADTDGDGLPDLPDADVPGRPATGDPRFNLQAIAPGVWPTAFSNPFLLDLDGGGWTAPGLP